MTENQCSAYLRLMEVINSCKTNSQNQVAFRMVMQYDRMFKGSKFTQALYDECDRNLIQVIGG